MTATIVLLLGIALGSSATGAVIFAVMIGGELRRARRWREVMADHVRRPTAAAARGSAEDFAPGLRSTGTETEQ
jgi:hypothetical protein